jgi:hypothetical protein
MALLFAGIGWILWTIARAARSPVIVFCLAGGLAGILTHIWAVFRGIIQKPPMLQGASPVTAVAFAAVEYALYWCIILGAAVAIHRLIRRGFPSIVSG